MSTQTTSLTRLLGVRAAKVMAWGLGVTALVVIGLLTGALVVSAEVDNIQFFVLNGVSAGVWGAVAMMAMALAITAFVGAIILVAAYARTLVSMGATRRNLAMAYLLVAAAMWLAVVALGTVAWQGVVHAGPAQAAALEFNPLASFGVVAIAVFSGLLIAAVFLVWRWWVGVGLIVFFLVVLPQLEVAIPALGNILAAVREQPVAPVTLTLLVIAAFWWVMSRLQLK